MGQLLSRIASILSSGVEEKRFLVLGLDFAGKTSLLYKMLHFDENITTVPTIGITLERVKYKDMYMTIWDMSDHAKFRPLWRHYYPDTDAVIFMIDSSDRERLEEARDLMLTVLADPKLHGCRTVLIFLNKQDLPGAVSPSLMIEKLELDSFEADPLKRRKWHMQACCANTGDGVHQGLEWLSDVLNKEKARPITS